MRQAVLGVVLTRGHVTASDVQRETGLSWGASQWHLKKLQREGALSSMRLGRRVAYHAQEDERPERELLARRVLSNPQAVRVARALVEARGGGARVRDVRRAARVSQRLAYHYVARFEREGLVWRWNGERVATRGLGRLLEEVAERERQGMIGAKRAESRPKGNKKNKKRNK